MERLITLPAREVLRRMWLALQPESTPPPAHGSVTLRPHQVEGVARVLGALRRHRGALLADDVGTGKTYIALEVARRLNARPLVVAPASLREMWVRSADAYGLDMRFMSVEGMSRGTELPDGCTLLIADEAHALRNPRTSRYRAVAHLAARLPALLISATPVHNSEQELHAQLALFLGERSRLLSSAELATVVIRREGEQIRRSAALPPVEHHTLPPLPEDDQLLAAILGLPPPLPPSDGGDGGALTTFTLIRQWSSSGAALVRALSRRILLGTAMLEALRNDVHPTASELSEWCASGEAVQLPLFGLLETVSQRAAVIGGASDVSWPRMPDVPELRRTVQLHLDALHELQRMCATAAPALDSARDAAIRSVADSHRGEKVLAFSQFEATVRALFRLSLRWGRSGMIAGSGGRIASGRISRDELVRLFAPHSNGAVHPVESRRVDILFSSDVLSEGANLQDASVLVHLDLPWTPMRVAQRVGRLVRPGSAAARVAVYTFLPPASAEGVLRMERRLAAKLSVAARSAGVSGTTIPFLHIASPLQRSPAQCDAEIRSILRSVIPAVSECTVVYDGIAVGRVAAEVSGFIALYVDGRSAELLGCTGERVSSEPVHVLEGMRVVAAALSARGSDCVGDCRGCCGGAGRTGTVKVQEDVVRALAQISRWESRRAARMAAGLAFASAAPGRGALLRRIDRISAHAPRHLRPRIEGMAARARAVALRQYGAGGEQVLAELAAAQMPDEAWLRAIETFGSLQPEGGANGSTAPAGARVSALLLYGPGALCSAAKRPEG